MPESRVEIPKHSYATLGGKKHGTPVVELMTTRSKKMGSFQAKSSESGARKSLLHHHQASGTGSFVAASSRLWGSEWEEDSSVRFLQDTCSLNEDPVTCEEATRTCDDNKGIQHCNVICYDACSRANITDSTVECVNSGSCNDANFRESNVTCSYREDTCYRTSFLSSAVKCEGPASCPNLNGNPLPQYFHRCSCCSGEGCPSTDVIASCVTSNGAPANDFCKSTYLGRTCKDWGNPICNDINVTSPPPLHPASTCLLGEDVALCEENIRDCNGINITNCSVDCYDACNGANITDSTVECVKYGSCNDASFRRSKVTCSFREDACYRTSFLSSAVECEGLESCPNLNGSPLPQYFHRCSCCSGAGLCPSTDVIASCLSSNSTADDFCKSTYLGRTCKDWGNPICDDINVTSPPPLHPASTCLLGEDVALCEENIRDCNGINITNCSVDCYDACNGANITDSTVECVKYGSCNDASFRRSKVTCSFREDACYRTNFLSSAVECEGLASCPNLNGSPLPQYFHRCSCCSGAGLCPSTDVIASCSSSNSTADDFCKSTYLGRTCKDWGNPICDDINVTSPPPLHPASTCLLGEDVALCEENIRDCNGINITNCSVDCYDACNGANITDSTVECVKYGSCNDASFRRSKVTCSFREDACYRTNFLSSAVECEGLASCPNLNGSPLPQYFHRCSCCSGAGLCPSTDVIASCLSSNSTADDFCKSTYLGRTCKDWGNPICDDINVTSPPPLHPASTCLLGEDVALCEENIRDCNGINITNCSVDCYDACNGANITDSTVECVKYGSCNDASFRRSKVTCSFREDACYRTNFISSAVECEGLESCPNLNGNPLPEYFDRCSCCDGLGCPTSVSSCTRDVESFCMTQVSGTTCEALGNPVCQKQVEPPTTSEPATPKLEPTTSGGKHYLDSSLLTFVLLSITLLW